MWWPAIVEALFDNIGDRRFSGARQPSEPNDSWLLLFQRGALGLSDEMSLAMNIGSAPQPERDHAGADGAIGEPVDDDE